jgi:ATP-dependent exoDNAse (exonuclease V) alpha subunit
MTQEKALEVLKSGKNVFLTGEPGAGKTYTINLFQDYLASKGIHPEMTASTGIAATHINGITIHSWSGIGIKDTLTEQDIRHILGKPFVVKKILDASTLIIDEISMLNAGTLDNVDKVCRAVKGSIRPMDAEKPFGGLQVIFVGDFFQLPPVSRKEMAKFAFESQAWLSAEPVICYLTEQHRQEDSEFLEILNALRNGKVTKKHKDRLKKCMVKAPKNITRLFTHNADVDRVNEDELRKIEGETKSFEMFSSGIPFMIDIIKKSCLSPEVLNLKVGAIVMFTRNNFDEGYVNGTLAKVIGYSNGLPTVKTTDGSEITVKHAEWKIEEHGYTKAKVSQIPLRLAWAITVHKCQGMSLDAATIDLSSAFEYGQGYVALSRVRSLEGLYLEGINDKAFEMHPTVVKKDGSFRKLSEI